MDATVTSPLRSAAQPAVVRIQRSLLTTLEKRTLIWMAERMPRVINSDHLTGLALLAMAGAGLSYWLARYSSVGLLLVAIFLALNWFGDSLDGTLARVRQCQRPRYGYYVDHVVDVIGAVLLFGGLASSGFMSVPIAALLLMAYFILCLEVYLATVSLGDFRMSFFGVGPTELRILLAVGNLVAWIRPDVVLFGHTFKLFDVGGLVGAIGLGLTFVYSVLRNTRALYLAEPVPSRVS